MDTQSHVTPTAHIAGAGAYNPYNGKEKLDILMKRIYAQLRDDQSFAQHLTSTKFEIEFTLVLREEALVPTVIKGKQLYELRPQESTFNLTVTSEPAPDTMRRAEGLLVPQPTLTTGGMVDIPMQAQLPPQ
jgi:hypothetical protein